jgi:hypothetical protein
MKRNWKRKIPLIILLSLAAVTAFSGLVMVLWNGILPQVLHVGVITFWQAAGILLLGRLLFGGLKGRRHRMMGGCGGDYRRREWAQGGCRPLQGAAQE